MTERRPFPAGEHGGYPSRLVALRSVADGVHTAMDSVKPPLPYTPRNRGFAQATGRELRESDHTVLQSGNVGHLTVWRGAFLAHSAGKAPRQTDSPPGGRRARAADAVNLIR